MVQIKKKKIKKTSKRRFLFFRNKSKRQKKEFWKKFFVRVSLLSLAFFMALFICGLGIFLYFAKDLPTINEFAELTNAESTKIYDKSGKVMLYKLYGEENRTIVSLDEISPYLRNATLAVEDTDFYNHPGIYPKSMLRALWVNLQGGVNTQGGSTITQQLIKNTMLTSERTFERKIREAILSLELENKYTKDEILEAYLNQIPYGSNSYGAQSAAQSFFDKKAKDLTLGEAAILAALPNQPSYLSPYGEHREELQSRQEHVLNRMQENGFISQKQKEEAIEEGKKYNITEEKEYNQFITDIESPHFVFYVKEELEKWAEKEGYEPANIETMGLKVTTTLDWDLQTKAKEIVAKYNSKNSVYNISNMGLAAIEPETGHIVTMIGSAYNWEGDEKGEVHKDARVNITIRDRQPGSTFKPYVYGAAFERGFTPDTIIYDVLTNFGSDGSGQDYIPRNYDGTFSGPLEMRKTLQRSLNIPAIKTYYLAKPENVNDFTEKIGLDMLNSKDLGLATAIGTKEVKLINHVGAISTYANDGMKVEKTSILKIEDSTGRILLDNTREAQIRRGQKVMKTNTARLINNVLSDNSVRTFGQDTLIVPGYQVGAKTGTSNQDVGNGKTLPTDAWTIGYSSNLASAVWAGNNDNSPLRRDAVGLLNAAPAWQEFMKYALAKYPKKDFNLPGEIGIEKPVLLGEKDNGITVEVCKFEGKLATVDTPASQRVEKVYGGGTHNILYFVNRDNPTGPVPFDPKSDSMFDNWEAGVAAWGGVSSYTAAKPPSEYCKVHNSEYRPYITLSKPSNNQTLQEGIQEISVLATSPLSKNYAEISIKQVEYYLNGNHIGTVSEGLADQFTLKYDFTGSLGENLIEIRVFDSIDNMSAVNVRINVIEGDNFADDTYSNSEN